MGGPSGSDYQIGWAFERANNLPPAVINNFFYSKGVTGFHPKPIRARAENLLPDGDTPQSEIVRFESQLKIPSQPDVDSIAKRRAWHNRYYSIANPTAGVYDWSYRPKRKADTPATYVETAAMEITDGDGYPILLTGARPDELEIKIEDGKIVEINESIKACIHSYMSTATVALAATYTGKPVVVGNLGKNTATPVKVKVYAIADANADAYVKFTYGAAAYSGSNIPIKFDKYTQIVDGSGVFSGVDNKNSQYIMFPSGAGALAVNDEFTFTTPRVLTSPSFSTRKPLSATAFTITLDGVLYGGAPNTPGFRNATVKIILPTKFNTGGSMWPISVDRDGDPLLTLKVSRDRDDRVLLEKCLRNERFPLILNMWGNPIGSTGLIENWRFTCANMEIPDLIRDVNTKNRLPEDADFASTGQPYDEFLRCTVATAA